MFDEEEQKEAERFATDPIISPEERGLVEARASRAETRLSKADARQEKLRDFLLTLDKPELVGLVLRAAADWLPELNEELELRRLRPRPGVPLDIAAWKARLKKDFARKELVKWGQQNGFIRRAAKAAEALEGLLKDGAASEVVELAEYALERAETVMGRMGHGAMAMGEICQRIEHIHLAACQSARPDPAVLARRLCERELESGFSFFYDAAKIYREILGPIGLRAFRRRAEQEWEKFPPLPPEEDRPSSQVDLRRDQAERMLEQLLQLDGEAHRLPSLYERNLNHWSRFLKIAKVCHEQGRARESRAWAERGLKIYKNCGEAPLAQFLADRYAEDGLHDEALPLEWKHFIQRPGVAAWKTLKLRAETAGVWPETRIRALQRLEEEASRPAPAVGLIQGRGANFSLIIEVLLADSDPDAAMEWARRGPVNLDLITLLAKARKDDHPEESIELYRRLIPALIEQGTQDRYEDAAEALCQVRPLYRQLNQDAVWEVWLTELRGRYRSKRNFMALIENTELDTNH